MLLALTIYQPLCMVNSQNMRQHCHVKTCNDYIDSTCSVVESPPPPSISRFLTAFHHQKVTL